MVESTSETTLIVWADIALTSSYLRDNLSQDWPRKADSTPGANLQTSPSWQPESLHQSLA